MISLKLIYGLLCNDNQREKSLLILFPLVEVLLKRLFDDFRSNKIEMTKQNNEVRESSHVIEDRRQHFGGRGGDAPIHEKRELLMKIKELLDDSLPQKKESSNGFMNIDEEETFSPNAIPWKRQQTRAEKDINSPPNAIPWDTSNIDTLPRNGFSKKEEIAKEKRRDNLYKRIIADVNELFELSNERKQM